MGGRTMQDTQDSVEARRRRVLRYWHIPAGHAGSRSDRDMDDGASGVSEQPRRVLAVVPVPGPVESDPFPGALSRIARIVSETLELKEVFAHVAEAASEVLPFETMGVCRLETPDTLRLYAVAGSEGKEPGAVVRIEDFSPVMRPRPAWTQRIDDARVTLDPGF